MNSPKQCFGLFYYLIEAFFVLSLSFFAWGYWCCLSYNLGYSFFNYWCNFSNSWSLYRSFCNFSNNLSYYRCFYYFFNSYTWCFCCVCSFNSYLFPPSPCSSSLLVTTSLAVSTALLASSSSCKAADSLSVFLSRIPSSMALPIASVINEIDL